MYDLPNATARSGFVRGSIVNSGMIGLPLPRKSGVEIYQVMTMDVKGFLPKMLYASFLRQMMGRPFWIRDLLMQQQDENDQEDKFSNVYGTLRWRASAGKGKGPAKLRGSSKSKLRGSQGSQSKGSETSVVKSISRARQKALRDTERGSGLKLFRSSGNRDSLGSRTRSDPVRLSRSDRMKNVREKSLRRVQSRHEIAKDADVGHESSSPKQKHRPFRFSLHGTSRLKNDIKTARASLNGKLTPKALLSALHGTNAERAGLLSAVGEGGGTQRKKGSERMVLTPTGGKVDAVARDGELV